jgi:hypothetical protein
VVLKLGLVLKLGAKPASRAGIHLYMELDFMLKMPYVLRHPAQVRDALSAEN